MIKKVFLFSVILSSIIIFSSILLKNFSPKYKNNSGSVGSVNKTSEKKTINLTTPKDSRRVIYETDKVTISFGLDEFKNNLEKFIKLHDIKSDKSLLAYIEEQSKTNSKIRIDNIDVKLGFSDRIKYRVADMLESGSFTLYDKANKIFLKSIIVETHGMNCGDLCGSGGRNFMFGSKNTIFFYTMDWIS